MQAPGTPSVDQLLVLLTVVEEGSFSAAAKRLRRATSAISYADRHARGAARPSSL
jgi:DNA-binding transcriptional LysR family regulator